MCPVFPTPGSAPEPSRATEMPSLFSYRPPRASALDRSARQFLSRYESNFTIDDSFYDGHMEHFRSLESLKGKRAFGSQQ